MEQYEKTGLWQRALGSKSDWTTNDALTALRANYSVFRERASILTAQIAKTLPNLTIHDVTHLDALWDTADLIAGEGYPLNPAEAFVLGGAILTHDAALCFEAYEHGQAGLRDTVEWKDVFAAIRNKTESVHSKSDLDEADFAAMRQLHASRAAELATASWTTPEGDKLYLIESHELRKHYGQIIGKIAASHHWPIEDLISKLPPQVNAIGNMPRDWRVDPVKVACLLRCADAAHIDSRRAPDFLRALTTLHGVSASHWTAQNWLERADIDEDDPERSSLIFTSGKQFDEANADAWWVAYDALRLIDKELRSSAELLETRNRSSISPPFQMRRVTGANSPIVASKTITTNGWTPQSVEIHVSNLERLISQLGGDKLYGPSQSLIVVLRELIQNSRDSIVARRTIDKDFVGRIRVIVPDPTETNKITIEDDGVGMSYRVITGPLLDFGSSFWASNLVRDEFPGLLSGGYKPVGKFGIGFYSVFMTSSAVSIASRRFDEGLDRVTSVRFPKGLSLRPLISTGAPASFGFANSTSVTLELQKDYIHAAEVMIAPGRAGYEPEVIIPMQQCLAILCAGLDVTVELKVGDTPIVIAHAPLKASFSLADKLDWMKSITGPVPSSDIEAVIAEHVGRMRPITENNIMKGMAALSTSQSRSLNIIVSISTVGGLASTINPSDFYRFVGMIDFTANSAKREPSNTPAASREALAEWATEQVSLLPKRENNLLDWCVATGSLADLGFDPIDMATVAVRNREGFTVLDLDSLVDLIESDGLAIYKSHVVDQVEMHHNQGSYLQFPTLWPVKHSALLSLERDSAGAPPLTSILSCILRRASEKGIRIKESLIPEAVRSHFGPMPVLLLEAEA